MAAFIVALIVLLALGVLGVLGAVIITRAGIGGDVGNEQRQEDADGDDRAGEGGGGPGGVGDTLGHDCFDAVAQGRVGGGTARGTTASTTGWFARCRPLDRSLLGHRRWELPGLVGLGASQGVAPEDASGCWPG